MEKKVKIISNKWHGSLTNQHNWYTVHTQCESS